MCDICNGMSRRQSRERSELRIARNGFTMTWVEPSLTSEPFGYTMGLTDMKHPELLISGLRADDTAEFLTSFAHRVLAHGDVIKPGLLPLADDYALYVLEVESPARTMVNAYELYKGRMTGLQLVRPDDEGRYPWARGADRTQHQVIFGGLPLF